MAHAEIVLTKPKVLGSIRAWSIWLVSAFFMFYKYALEISPSIMTVDLMQTFHIDGAALGHLAACYFYAYLLMQLPAGLLIDRFGPRKVTTLALIMCGVGSLLFAGAQTLWMASAGRFLIGGAAAFAAVNCMKLIANWFSSKQFALMVGLMMTLGMLGAVGGQAPLSWFIHLMNWRSALQVLGFVGIGLGFVFWLIVRDAPVGKQEKVLFSFKEFKKGVSELVRNGQAWWLSLYSGFAFAPVMVFGGLWGVSFLKEAFSLNLHLSAQAVSLIFIGFAVGSPILGSLSNWLGRRKPVMFIGTFLSTLLIVGVVYIPSLPMPLLDVMLFLFGFCISSFLLCFTMIKEVTPLALAATAVGFMNAFDALFGAFSDPLTGYFLDSTWEGKLIDGARHFSVVGYKLAFVSLPVFLVIALGTLWKIKETHCRSS